MAIISAKWILGGIVGCAMAVGGATSAATARQEPASIVIDANTGRTLHADAADAARYPASLTKMMTLFLVFERLESGNLSEASRITFSQTAAEMPPSKLGLGAGESITLGQAIRALVIKSANDVATAVAEHIASSEPAFARLMTEKARMLGMARTRFRNASGLSDPDQVTTARDMAILAMALQDHFPERFRVFSQRRFAFGGTLHRTHNRLLGRVPGVDGIKTGYTSASGFNITTSVRRDGKSIIGVVIGQPSGRRRNGVMQRLIAQALPKASRQRTRPSSRMPVLIAAPRLVRRPVRWPVTQPPAIGRAAPPGRRPPTAAIVVSARAAPATTTARAPSTLNGQAARLRTGAAPSMVMPVDQHTQAAQPPTPRSAPRSAAGLTHQVQVGAFTSDVDARNALSLVRARAGTLLDGHEPLSIAARIDTRLIYRARFAGFDPKRAADTCLRLRSVRVDCFVVKSN